MKRYDLDVGKRRARNRLYEFLKTRIYNRKEVYVLCFPGEYGLEIERVYRRLGIPDKNIFGVERDPKAAKRIRERYPDINLYEGEIFDFCANYDGPPLSVVSLDYCGHFGNDKMFPLALLSSSLKLANRCVIAVNVMAGREDKDTQQTMRTLHQRTYVPNGIDIYDALERMAELKDTDLAEIRDHALTEGLIMMLAYLIPATRVCFQFDLTHTYGEMVVLGEASKIIDDDGTGKMKLTDVEVIDSKRNVWQLARQIKHEAIMSINKELNDHPWLLKAIRKSVKGQAEPVNFFEYHVGRALVMAFFDKYGGPLIPVSMDRISYISESGKRMISDYVEFKSFDTELDQMQDVVTIFKSKTDESIHTFKLSPQPPMDGDASPYVKRLTSFVYKYVSNVVKYAKTEKEYWPEREDLGGGDPIPVDMDKIKAKALEMLKSGKTVAEVADKIRHLSKGTLRAMKAHLTMRTERGKRLPDSDGNIK